MHFLDSSAWMAYFFGEPGGKQIAAIIDSNEPILLSVTNLAEIYSQFLMKSTTDSDEKRMFLMTRCQLAEVTGEIAMEAARIKAKHRLALADALLLATGRVHSCSLQTFDPDFQGLKGARLLVRR